MKSIYYRFSDGVHFGEIAFKELIPGGDSLGSSELADLGWEKKSEIPDDWDIHCRYRNGQLTVRPDPPPYWDSLGMALPTNSLFQRLQPLRFAIQDVDTAMGLISDVVGIGKSQRFLASTVMTLKAILAQAGQPITPQEIAETEALLIDCGFEPNFFTYAQNIVNPPPPPIII